jgi:hypothetical protein
MLAKLASITTFDLTHGPYFVGSYVTKNLAQQFHTVDWQPSDVDIICRTEEQMFHLKDKFLPIAGYHHEKEREVVSQMFGVHPLHMIWVIDGITVTASIRDYTAMEQIKTADYTVTAAASDGMIYLATAQTLADIKDNVLRKLSFDMNRRCVGTEATAWVLEKYTSYINRGFIDKDNLILKELNTLVA